MLAVKKVKLSSDKSYSLIPGLTICKRRKKMKDWKIAWNYYVILSLFLFFIIRAKRVLVFCFQNCSNLLWENIVQVIKKNFGTEGQEFANFWKSSDQNSNSERLVPFLKQNTLLTCFWLFLRSYTLEQC